MKNRIISTKSRIIMNTRIGIAALGLCSIAFVGSTQAATITQVGAGSDFSASSFDDAGAARWNLDRTSAAVLTAGTYDVVDFEYLAGTTQGDVQPFLAIETGTDVFTFIWVGDTAQSSAGAGVKNVSFTAGTEQFTLGSDATVLAGFNVSDAVIAYAAGGPTAHHITPNWDPTVGSTMSGIWKPTLPRTYAFEINVSSIPEPSAYALIGGLLALSCVMLRRRRVA